MNNLIINNSSKNNRKKGFTLTELIIVMVIIAILAVVITPNLLAFIEKAKQTSDLKIVSNIVKSATYAIVDPDNGIPEDHFIEIIWVTGEESDSRIERGTIIIRHNDTERVSVYNDGKDGDDATATKSPQHDDALLAFAQEFADYFGVEYEEDYFVRGWIGVPYSTGQSKLSKESNFAVHVSTSNGQVAMSYLKGAKADPNRWVEIGLDIIPAPEQ